MSASIIAIVCAVFEFIVFLFIVLSVGADILRNKTSDSWPAGPNVSARVCLSFWGVKRCGPHRHNPNDEKNKGFPSKKILSTVTTAAAFDIVGLVTSLVCFVTCLLYACKCCSAIIPILFAVLTIVFVIITIGCLLGVWYTKLDPEDSSSRVRGLYGLAYGAILIVAAWCVQIVILIALIIGCCCCAESASTHEEDGGEEESDKNSEL